jgi:hypothetical protein
MWIYVDFVEIVNMPKSALFPASDSRKSCDLRAGNAYGAFRCPTKTPDFHGRFVGFVDIERIGGGRVQRSSA